MSQRTYPSHKNYNPISSYNQKRSTPIRSVITRSHSSPYTSVSSSSLVNTSNGRSLHSNSPLPLSITNQHIQQHPPNIRAHNIIRRGVMGARTSRHKKNCSPIHSKTTRPNNNLSKIKHSNILFCSSTNTRHI